MPTTAEPILPTLCRADLLIEHTHYIQDTPQEPRPSEPPPAIIINIICQESSHE